jgi:phosphoenolpyruvate synthase/pyruvate phosphate dikinase
LLQQLSQLASTCEQLFGSPQDIEWAVADNRVWLLQSRPITSK